MRHRRCAGKRLFVRFVHEFVPARVIFGAGMVGEIGEEIARLGARRVLLVASPSQAATADRVAASLGAGVAARIGRTASHVPVERAKEARRIATEVRADAIVAVGGGSAIGLAKVVALTHAIPILAVPTTYSGSEMTSFWGMTEGGAKTTGRDARVLPRTVLYDPALTLTLPVPIAAASGLNAMAHAVEALYGASTSPVSALMAEDCIRSLASGLRRVARAPADLEARAEALYGSFLGGAALEGAVMGLHHKLCHVLGGTFGLNHAETHAVILPHAIAYNAGAAQAAMTRIARALGAADPAAGLHALAKEIGASTALRALGLAERDLDRAAELATQSPYDNPRKVERAPVRALLDDAFFGRPPNGGVR
jgi:maleylacetate reductase